MRIDILIIIGYQKTFVRHILYKTKTSKHTKTLLILPEHLTSQIQQKLLINIEIISLSEKLDQIRDKLLLIVQKYADKKHVDNKHILHVITRREREVLRLIKNGKKQRKLRWNYLSALKQLRITVTISCEKPIQKV